MKRNTFVSSAVKATYRALNAALCSIVLFLMLATAGKAAERQFLQKHVPAAVTNATLVRHSSRWNRLNLDIGLPLRNRDALNNLLQQLYDPASTNFHRFLTPQEFAQQFGPTEADYQAVISFAKAHGLSIAGTHSNRTVLQVRGAVADIERAFHVTLNVYQHPTEARTFFAPDVEPSLDLAVPVLTVGGLDNFVVPHPCISTNRPPAQVTGSGPGGYFLGYDFRRSYAPGSPLTGVGQTVGLVEFDGYYPGDVTAYEQLAGLPNVPVNKVLLDGFNGSPGGANIEVALDIDMAISMAPGLSQVLVYEGTTPNDVLNRIATDRIANQISASWTYSINATTIQIFQQFAAQGQSFYNASGDTGAYSGSPSPPTDNPYITSVGGTDLTTTPGGGAWTSETAWPLSSGGISTTYAIPNYQQGINMSTNQGSTTYRNLPDVAMIADNCWLIFNNGQTGIVGGTSIAAPLWAGFTALINQLALTNGEPTVGFINPAVYGFGKGSNALGYTALFHDITTGNNENSGSPSHFSAVPGYDLCTGWGTPTGSNLISALALPEPLRIAPLAPVIISGPVGGPFNPVNVTYTLTDGAKGSLNWSLINTSSWLNVFPVSGVVSNSGPAGVVTATLLGTASNLSAGSYTAALRFTNLNDNFVQTRSITLAVVTPPIIISQPTNQAVLVGMAASFSVSTATNALLFYQWQVNGTNLADGVQISGSATSTLAVSNCTSANVGSYSVIVSNAAGVTVSSNALLTIVPSPPVIVQQPTNQTVLPGQSAMFNVAAVGDRPYIYHWQFNGTNLANSLKYAGATASSFVVSNVSFADAGAYSVVISNSLGFTNSIGAMLSVIPVTAPGVNMTGLWSFTDGNSGEFLYSPLVQGHDGFLYGTTIEGGSGGGYGTVFRASTNGGSPITLFSFNYNNGGIPYGGLVLGRDGYFYGTTYEGGGYGDGTIFKMSSGGSMLILVNLNGQNGSLPVGGLMQGADGNFYGTTLTGGAYGDGTVFKITSTGALTTLVSFNGANGADPSSVLIQGSDGYLYGTTEVGGTKGLGTIFKISPSGAFASLYSFTGSSDGAEPIPGLTQGVDGNFYGNTITGGSGGYGTVFQLTPSGTLNTLYSFTDRSDGGNPWGGLMQSTDGNLYGTTQVGGTYGFGTVFRIAPNGPLTAIAQFESYNGANPSAAIIQGVDGNLYGTTLQGGVANEGTLFKLNMSGALQITGQPSDQSAYLGGSAQFTVATSGGSPVFYQWQENGTNLVDGGNISGSTTATLLITNVTLDDAALYSVLVSNSVNSVLSDYAVLGITYSPPRLTTQPASITRIVGTTASFTVSAEGDLPLSYQWQENGTNLVDGGTLSGSISNTLTLANLTFANAGTYSVIVSNPVRAVPSLPATLTVVLPTAPSASVATVRQFTGGSDGAFPYAGLIQAKDGNLYGTTIDGGTRFSGTAFRLSLNNAFVTLASFGVGTGGINPYGQLLQSANSLFYGTTFQGGTNGGGTVYQMLANGSLSFMYSFTGGNDGAFPYAGLVQGTDGNYYGTAYEYGAYSDGTVFKMNATRVVTGLYEFTGGEDGALPYAGLIQGADGRLYGTTSEGGGFGYGTVFSLTTSGTLTTLASFDNVGSGAVPQAGVIQGSDGYLYGTTRQGGTNGYGTVFRVSTNGVLTTLFSFGNTNGANPEGNLVQGNDGNFYGTTASGGAGGQGSVFKITTNGVLTTLLWFDGLNGANPQGALVQANNGYFYGTTPFGGSGFNPYSGGGYGTIFQLTVPVFINNAFFAASAVGALPYLANITNAAIAPPGDTLSFAKVSGPAWLVVAANGALSGTPANSDIGTNIFIVSLTDTNGVSASATMKVVVTQDPPPSFVLNPFTQPFANVGQGYSGNIATNAYDLELPYGDVLTFAKISGPAWLNVGSDGTLSGTPQGPDDGTNTFVVSVVNLGTLSNTATMFLYVNGPPYFTSHNLSKPAATVGIPYSGTIATNATDPDLNAGDFLTFYKASGPAWLNVALDGALSGTPAGGDVGPGSYLVLVVDSGGLAGVGTLNLAVNADRPPVFISSPFTEQHANAGQAYSATIATNVTDPDLGDVLTLAKVSGPAWLTIATNGLLSGTPSVSDAGTNSFVVSVTDIPGLSNQATMFITVAGPISLSISKSGGQVTLGWTGGYPPYQVLMGTDVASRVWSNLSGPLNTNKWTFTPNNSAAFFRVQGQ
jgi:uncharacterized repeat protein (TIGR03803 family)